MIRFVRTASIAPGKAGDAMVFAKQVSEYLDKQHGLKLEVMVPVGGNPFRIGWRAEYPSLAAMEQMDGKLMADPKYLELVARGGQYFNPGSVNDAIWRTV